MNNVIKNKIMKKGECLPLLPPAMSGRDTEKTNICVGLLLQRKITWSKDIFLKRENDKIVTLIQIRQ